MEEFTTAMEEVLTIKQQRENTHHRWNYLRDIFHTTVFQVFGRHWENLRTGSMFIALVENKHSTLLNYKQCPIQSML